MIYEYYRDGRLVERQEPLDQPGDAGETRIQLAILDREESGELDGWYREGEYGQVAASADEYEAMTVAELRKDLQQRDMDTAGNKAALIMRLRADDMATTAEPADEQPVDGGTTDDDEGQE